MNFATLKGLTIPDGVVTQIADASGRVLWSATIKFTINGDTYIADRGMTWAEWFASSYNTTGETEGDIKDANGNEVSMDAVIVNGAVYDVSFAEMVTLTLTMTGNGHVNGVMIRINGSQYSFPQKGNQTLIEVPIGTVIELYNNSLGCKCGEEDGRFTVVFNDGTSKNTSTSITYTVVGNTTIDNERSSYSDCDECYKSYYGVRIRITEQ